LPNESYISYLSSTKLQSLCYLSITINEIVVVNPSYYKFKANQLYNFKANQLKHLVYKIPSDWALSQSSVYSIIQNFASLETLIITPDIVPTLEYMSLISYGWFNYLIKNKRGLLYNNLQIGYSNTPNVLELNGIYNKKTYSNYLSAHRYIYLLKEPLYDNFTNKYNRLLFEVYNESITLKTINYC
jgi:hypothetical protein